jgi:crotonobetainyl-CoA:carnitine CoA-transferase CaiB-like acyl-CoA transferase
MLTGYKVIDLTQFVAGPTCCRILAEMGAEVVKVELAPYGDRSRVQGVRAKRAAAGSSPHSTYFFQHNHSKRTIALDFKNPRGRDALKQLIAKADVLVESFSPGVMARAGLSYDDLKAANPGLVMCSISLAGQTGSLSKLPGYDYIGQAYAGVTGLIGEPDRGPAMTPIAIGDVSTGVSAAMAIGFALLHRERTGEGQLVESTLLDTYFHMHEASIPRASMLGESYMQQRTGSQHPDGGPTGIYLCGDGRYITLMVLSHQWPQLVSVLGQPSLLEDARFATARERRQNNEQLKEILEAWLATIGSREDCLKTLEAERIPCAPVLSLPEAIGTPHLRERGTVREVQDPALGTFDIPGMPARFSAWSFDQTVRAGRLGEHNEEVLAEFGFKPDAIEELHREKVFVKDEALEP